MINMYSKYDNMHMNVMFYALIYINNHIITSISYMLSLILTKKFYNISSKDMYISKDFGDMKRRKPMKIKVPTPNPLNP